MNISYNWLKDLIDIDLSADELARRLTDVGLAVEAVHPAGQDNVFDIDLTSNRPDCLSHLGVAREIKVMVNGDLRSREDETHLSELPLPATLAGNVATIDDADLCPRFTGRIINNVQIGPSPQWLIERLEAIGERSINNVADITNFVMHELGQPMHSFDLDKLAERRIVVRRAKAGEKITTLDDVERELDTNMLAICDAEKPVAVAGVMGGLDSGITDNTTNVLLEVAYFQRESIRATSRKLDLATEASYRFERGVDIDNLIRASSRATRLICELAGGAEGDFVDVYPSKLPVRHIESPDITSAVLRLTGLKVSTDECHRILSKLGIGVPDDPTDAAMNYVSPTWRHDLAIEEDLVEEVARHVGYENIRSELPPAFGAGEYQPNEDRKMRLRQSLAGLGFDEAVSYSFIDTGSDDRFDLVPALIQTATDEKYVTLKDSVIESAIRMRPTVIPGLLNAVRLNLNHQRKDVKLFEVGKVFATGIGEDMLPTEQESFALVLTGGERHEDVSISKRDLDFFDAKGALQTALAAAGMSGAEFGPENVRHLQPGQSASVTLGGRVIGYLGRLEDSMASQYKFKQPVYVAEINLDTALGLPSASAAYQPLSKYPSVVRDVSFLGPRNVSFKQVTDAAIAAGYDLLREVSYVDVYEGKGMPEGNRSLTVRFEYRSDERTLTEEEVEAVHQPIVARIEEELALKQRV
jgi:phenylalanyl-tRNA synthetase beta chain